MLVLTCLLYGGLRYTLFRFLAFLLMRPELLKYCCAAVHFLLWIATLKGPIFFRPQVECDAENIGLDEVGISYYF